MPELGILTGLVDDVGALMAAGLALTLAFKGRNKWEPVEEDIPNVSVRIVGLLTAVGVGILYFKSVTGTNANIYMWLAIMFSIILLVGLFFYILLITIYTYVDVKAPTGASESKKVIGGFSLTDDAKEALKKYKTVQEVYFKAAYEKDLVWTRPSQALAKFSFLFAYFLIITGGCFALASGAIMLNGLD